MPFQSVQTSVPTTVRGIRITLIEQPDYASMDNPEPHTLRLVEYDVEVLDQNGARMIFPHSSGDLVPHLTQTQINNLLAFMSSMRAKATAEFLP
jgi:hypothetical protein